MLASRHKTDYWIKNDFTDVSEKDIFGHVDIHWHEFYEIELILDGGGTYNIDGIDYNIARGDLYVMSPSSVHFIDFSQKTRLVNFMFTTDTCDNDFLLNIFNSVPHIMMKLSEKNIEFFHNISKEMIASDNIKYQKIMANCVLGKIQALCENLPLSLKDEQMQRAILYIHNHFREKLSLSEVAKVAGYSTNYFSNKFTEYSGVSFKKYIADMRFSLAESLLLHTTLPITEISYACGFSDFSNFMLYFKRRHKKTPKQFRDDAKASV